MKKIIFLVGIFVIVAGVYFLIPKQNMSKEDLSTIQLPVGYTLDNYEVKEVTGESCSTDKDCVLPGKYAIQSNCPYQSICKENKCTVVCPQLAQ